MENVIYGQFVCAKSFIQTRPTWAQLSYWGLLPGSFFRGETLETRLGGSTACELVSEKEIVMLEILCELLTLWTLYPRYRDLLILQLLFGQQTKPCGS